MVGLATILGHHQSHNPKFVSEKEARMPPANIQWQAPLVHVNGSCSFSNSTMPTATTSSRRQHDVVRRIVSKSKLDVIQESSTLTTFGSDAASSSPNGPPPRRRASTRKRSSSSSSSSSTMHLRIISFFRTINAAIWLVSVLCILGYRSTWSKTLSHRATSTLPAEPPAPLDVDLHSPTVMGPLLVDTASVLVFNATTTSSLRTSGHLQAAATTVADAENDGIVHIIHTRFMQSQPHLVDLGLARMELLREFSLRSLERQSSQNFLWVIRTDPALNASLKEPLMNLLQHHDHHLLIASNENPNIQIHGIVVADPETVWSGDLEYAKEYLHAGQSNEEEGLTRRKVLESRLDADDALHFQFVETLQSNAYHELTPGKPTWKVWCASTHIEWQYHTATNAIATEAGVLISLKDKVCVSAGLTIGYTEGVRVHELPPIKHQELDRSLPSCSRHDMKCLDFINLFPTALRARTPTSAGMLNVLLGKKGGVDKRYARGAQKQEKIQDQMWEMATPRFGFSLERASRLRTYLKDHLHAIAVDNLEGQCSAGHSCKKNSKILLQAIVDDTAAIG